MKVFENAVLEQQRLNIERMVTERPDDWFLKSQMEQSPDKRTGFIGKDCRCWKCGRDVTQGDKAITVESLGNYIITGCPYCYASFCD